MGDDNRRIYAPDAGCPWYKGTMSIPFTMRVSAPPAVQCHLGLDEVATRMRTALTTSGSIEADAALQRRDLDDVVAKSSPDR